jgi:hypothetical protein
VNSVLPAWMMDFEDLEKTVARCPHCGSLGLQHMAQTSTSIEGRIKWCRRQRTRARTQAELEGWRAEEEGLWDAFLKRDHTYQYRHSPPSVSERYAMGLQDGQVLIRLAWVDCISQPASNMTQV